jgi:fructose/tagatose bisphosphate aldolase
MVDGSHPPLRTTSNSPGRRSAAHPAGVWVETDIGAAPGDEDVSTDAAPAQAMTRTPRGSQLRRAKTNINTDLRQAYLAAMHTVLPTVLATQDSVALWRASREAVTTTAVRSIHALATTTRRSLAHRDRRSRRTRYTSTEHHSRKRETRHA